MIQNLLKRFTVFHRLIRLDAKLNRLNKMRIQSLREVNNRREEFARLEERLKLLMTITETSLREAKDLQDQYKREIDAVRNELIVMQETERALIAANRTLLSRWQAETAIQIRRQGLRAQETNE